MDYVMLVLAMFLWAYLNHTTKRISAESHTEVRERVLYNRLEVLDQKVTELESKLEAFGH